MRCEFARLLGCTGEERFRRRSKRPLIKAGGHSSSKVGERLPPAVSGVSTSMDAMIRTRRSLTVRETSRCSGRPGAISRSVSRRSSSVRTGETLSGSRDRRVPIAGEPPLAAPEHSRSLRSVDFPAESHSMIRPCSLRTSVGCSRTLRMYRFASAVGRFVCVSSESRSPISEPSSFGSVSVIACHRDVVVADRCHPRGGVVTSCLDESISQRL